MHTEQSLSAQQIINAAQAMPLADLEKLVDEVLTIQASRRARSSGADESELIRVIEQKFSASDLAKMDELQDLRDDEQLSAVGYAELARLIDCLEEFHAARVNALQQLADLRGITLQQAIEQLNIKLPDYE